MDAILVLINTLIINDLNKIPTLTDPDAPTGDELELYDRFFQALANEEIKTDAKAADFLNLDEGSTAYLEFKKEFTTRLYHAILFADINLPELDDPERAIYLCWQRLAVLRYLLSLGANSAVMQIGKMLLEMAEQFELVPVVVETAMHLRQYYALHKGDRKRYNELCKLIDRYEQLGRAEHIAQDCLEDFSIHQQELDGNATMLLEQIETYLQQLSPLYQPQQTVDFLFAYYFFQIQKYAIAQHWQFLLQQSDKALMEIKVKKAATPPHLIPFYFNKALSLGNLQQLASANEALQTALQLETDGSVNWFRLQEFSITLLLHQAAYPEAWKRLKEVWKNQKLHLQTLRQQNILVAIRLWLTALPDLNQLTLSPREKGEFAVFKNTWMERLPNFRDPKPQVQLVLLLVQFVLFIKQKNQRLIQRCWDDFAVLERFFPLQEADYQRFNCFLALLYLWKNNGETPDNLGAEEAVILSRLEALPKNFSSPQMDLEIIPFETQWYWIKQFSSST